MDAMGWFVLKQISESSVENFEEKLLERLDYVKDLNVDEDGNYSTGIIFADQNPNSNSKYVAVSRSSEGSNHLHTDKKSLSNSSFTCNCCQNELPSDGYAFLVLNSGCRVCKACIPSYVKRFPCLDNLDGNNEKMVSFANDIQFPNCQLGFSTACVDLPYQQRKFSTELEEEKYPAKCRYCKSPISLEKFDSCSESIRNLRSELKNTCLDTSWCIEKKDFLTVRQFQYSVCKQDACRKHMLQACNKKLECGHYCGGILGEQFCLPCLEIKCHGHARLQNKGNLLHSINHMCPICNNLGIREAPSIQLQCGHIVHFHCAKNRFQKSSRGHKLDFLYCPCCHAIMRHYSLNYLLKDHLELLDLVKDKAVNQLKIEGLDKCDNSEHVEHYAMSYYQYYICKICKNPYYGGKRDSGNNQRCPVQFICRCCIAARSRTCEIGQHGQRFIKYKCWNCCSLSIGKYPDGKAVCESCHSYRKGHNGDFPSPKKCKGPEWCPLGMAHGPQQCEYCLGCMECKTLGH